MISSFGSHVVPSSSSFVRGTARLLGLASPLLVFALGCPREIEGTADPSLKPFDGAPTNEPTPDPKLPRVAAHTHGAVPVGTTLRVAFTQPVVDDPQDAPSGLLKFEPAIEGTAKFTHLDEIELKPTKPLPRGQRFTATVDLTKLPNIEGAPPPFQFQFAVLKQRATLEVAGLEVEDKDGRVTLRGAVLTADNAMPATVEGGLSIAAVGKGPRLTPNVTWVHGPEGLRHAFSFTGIARQADDYTLRLSFDGKSIGAEESAQAEERVPGSESFGVLQVRAVEDGGRHVELRFSDALRNKQRRKGLVSLATSNGKKIRLRQVVRGNILELYGRGELPGEVSVTLHAGLENAAGRKFKKDQVFEVTFDRLKPAVRFVGKGTIVPSSDGLSIPIETANLKRVTIEALEVPAQNMPQFLQVNQLDGNQQLKRVGRVVWRNKVDLGKEANLAGAWSRHAIDLSGLLKDENTGLIRLRLTFDPTDTLYTCPEGSRLPAAKPLQPISKADDDLGNWDDQHESSYWDNAGYSYWDLYENRLNPCNAGYYREYSDHKIAAERNVLLSDLGIIAKRGRSGDMLIVVTDVKTARSTPGATVEVIDYQQQVLARGTTNADGTVRVQTQRTPFLVRAVKDANAGFLRLSEGEANSIAHFDTSGAQVSRGLKGFFYGERGVWRPGDTVFLTFMLADKARPLPAAHPLHFSFIDPNGKLVEQQVRKESNDGFYVFHLPTQPEAPTGNWRARVKIGGATFDHVVKLEAIVPNRLKLGLESPYEILQPGESIDAELSAQWLHGAVAKNLRAEVEVALQPASTKFPKFDDYKFDSPMRRAAPWSETFFEGRLDAKGRTTIDEEIKFGGQAAGMMAAAFTTRVFEPSGASSVDRHSLPFSPYKRYLGLRLPKGDKARGMLLTDVKHKVEIVAVDEAGKLLDEDTEVSIKLYKINWRWWWEKGAENLTDYASRRSHRQLSSGRVSLKGGQGAWEFEIKYPEWGRYLVVATDGKGHQTGWVFYADWPGWAGRAQKDGPGGATVLNLVTDKTSAKVGDEVVLTIPAAVRGRALVSIESGSKVVDAAWVEVGEKPVQHKIKVTDAMAPNVFAHVTLLQPHMATGNDLPMRLYGITPIEVVDPTTRLHPELGVPEAFTPGKTARIKVHERDGRAMTYTLAIVDEGLLGLTRHRTPNPWKQFYARESLGVKTWDVYDDVAGAYGGQLENLLAIGGGAGGDEGGRQRANRFPPMVVFQGPFSLPASSTKGRAEEKVHEVKLPPYVGAVRVMVVAGHQEAATDAYGAASSSVFVRKPLIALGTLPRVVGPGERIALPAAIFALEDDIKDVTVKVSTVGPIDVVGDATDTLRFREVGDQIVPFALKVQDRLGIAKVKLEASAGKHSASFEIEIDVRHPAVPSTEVTAKTLASGASWKLDALPLHGMAGTHAATLELSRIPPLELDRHLGSLIRYPHGCVEQTTSRAFPQVHLHELVDLTDAQKTQIETHVKAAIQKLKDYQQPDGGFGYWPADRRAHDWSTSYVGHFLLEAKRAGYRVDSTMLTRWKRYQREAARSHRAKSKAPELAHAYRLFTLALARAPEMGAMNRFKQHELRPAARWRLAAAYALAGQANAAKKLVADQAVSVKPYVELTGTFGSDLRDTAMILEALVLMKSSKSAEVAKGLAERLGSATHPSYNTQATSYAFIAMQRWASAAGTTGDRIQASLQHGKSKASLASQKTLISHPLDPERKGALVVKNAGEGSLFARLLVTGLPRLMGPNAKGSPAYAKGIELDVKTLHEDGRPLEDDAKPEQGTDLQVVVVVKNKAQRKLSEMALTHILPAGFEIRNDRLDGIRPTQGESSFDYRDVRDDRVLTYFDIEPGQTKTFYVRAHAAYLGDYFLPPVSVEAMYDPSITARTASGRVSVVSADLPGKKKRRKKRSKKSGDDEAGD